MTNPWEKLPAAAPFVLLEDSRQINEYNETAKDIHKLHTHIYPEPFLGRPDAPVVILALNPGFTNEDDHIHEQAWFAEQSRKSLVHRLEPYPFLHLPQKPITPGAHWWHRKCKSLIEKVGVGAVSKNMLCLEFFPYHSIRFKKIKTILPSQLYTFHLLRSAMERGSEIVIMRSKKHWEEAVPELKTYNRVHQIKNPQNPAVSPNNLGAGFAEIIRRLAVSS